MNGTERRSGVEFSIVIPVFNNEDCLHELCRRLHEVLTRERLENYEIIFVDDGSRDTSREVLRRLAATDVRMKLVALSRNFGHQIAITAGLDHAAGRAVLMMDADLQDPPDVIPEFLAKWRDGNDVVYGVRRARLGESWLKQSTALIFYRILRRLTKVNIVANSGDFRLLSRRAVDTFNSLRERQRFVRGMVSWLGYRQIPVYYTREARWAGESQYSFAKLVRLAVDGIVSFSDVPLRLATWVGFAGALICLSSVAWALVAKLIWGVPVAGWASLVTVVVFIGSVQLVVLGVMGEYVGRIYEELKARPLYVIEERRGFEGGRC